MKELLSPSGDLESLKAAVHAGADAVYIGGKLFGARKFASNFDLDELKNAVDYCHLYGVRLFVTVNTMIYEEEMNSVLDYVEYLAKIGVDAVIVQDIGLICDIRKYFPNLEVHASTQLHNYRKTSFDLLEELGVKRVVLAREATLDEIKNIETPLEKEVFIHGAICISYSGQCLFSSQILGRSGNRGECAGMCRLPYSVVDDSGNEIIPNNYLLSPKELCTIPRFQELMESDIESFKIEGRMKSPAYVYLVTKIYRTLMDQFYKGEAMGVSLDEIKKLELIFHRGFTTGHLFGDTGSDLMNIESPNHIGIPLGEVVDVSSNKIKILLDEDINQEDGIRFVANGRGMIVNFLYDEKGLLISEAKKGSIVFVDNKIGLKSLSKVLKTSDKRLEKELLNYPLRRVPISFSFRAYSGENISCLVSDGKNEVELVGEIVDVAINRATTKKEVIDHLSRVGDTCYEVSSCDIEIGEDVFIPMKVVNQLRRDLLDLLTNKRLSRESAVIKPRLDKKSVEKNKNNVKLSCLVRNEEQLLACIDKVSRVYVTNYSLYKKYKDQYSSLYYRVDRVKPESTYNGERLLITEFCQVPYAVNNTVVSDYYLNVANLSFINYLKEKNVLNVTLSVECLKDDISSIASAMTEVVVYGKTELMLMKHCLFASCCKQGSTYCCSKSSYFLVDRNKEEYPLVMQNGVTHLFGYKDERFTKQELLELSRSGVSTFRLEFLEEGKEEIATIIKNYQEMLQNF